MNNHIYKPNDDSMVLYVDLSGSRRQDSIISDLSKENNIGTVSGARYSVGPTGNSVLSFDGVDDSVGFGSDSSTDFSKEMTVMAWVKWNVLVNQSHVLRRGAVTPGTGYFMCLDAGVARYAFFNTSNVIVSHSGAKPIVANRWMHLAMTVDGQYLSGYMNGSLDGSRLPTTASIASSSANNLVIGASSLLANYLNGQIGEVRAYKRALSPNEIFNIFEEERINYCL